MSSDKKRVRQSYARRKLRAELKAFLVQEWRGLMGIAAGLALLLSITYLQGPYLRGLTQAIFVMLFLGLVLFVFAIRSQAWNMLCGMWAEDNTRDEVTKACKQGVTWCQVSSIEVDGSDIDHVVLSPGGILMLESKWSFAPMSRSRAEQFAGSALATTRRLRSILRSHTVKRDRDVTAVVVVWGKGRSELPPGGVMIDGVRVLRGEDLTEWLAAHKTGLIGKDWAVETAALLETFADGQVRKRVGARP